MPIIKHDDGQPDSLHIPDVRRACYNCRNVGQALCLLRATDHMETIEAALGSDIVDYILKVNPAVLVTFNLLLAVEECPHFMRRF